MAPVPSTMKAVYITKTGGTEVLEYKTDVPVPTPIDSNLLVKNDFVGVNFIDTYFRTGLYPAPQFPYTLGREGEGTVVAVGNGDTLGMKVGDRVAYMGESAYAEFTSVPAAKAVQVPASFAPGTAAAALLQGLTALTLVREAHAVRAGDWVLVHAAAGGTGLLLCQLLRAVGANTIGTASTPAKAELARAAGAAHVIDYGREDVRARVAELTGGQGCAAVFDGVGRSTFDVSLDCVARKGSLVSFGNASGAVPPFTIARLAAKNARLMRPTLFNYVTTRDEFAGYCDQLFASIRDDGLDVRVHEIYPLSDVKRAHEDLEGRKTTGKLLLDPSK
ncbi:putative quinone oxidoreductase protein [Rosellinia necatrix]|uniref:Probable quinone oxidoreductase n=1 Tax=Rosellinia necatrix TaxID=77044 RepID=A0A1W2TDJ9_ROSNE|nr:putative quinone oxidoreductase protein [Rosellinia necatrix]